MTRPLRFLQVTTFYPPYNFGGDGLYVQRLSHALAARGHFVDVVHPVDGFRLLSGRDPGSEVLSHPNVTVHQLRSRFGWLSPLVTQQTGRPILDRAALAHVMERPADVVHFHNISLLGPDVLRMGGQQQPAVKLYTAHEYWLVCPTHLLWKFNREICDRPTCVSCTLAAGRPPQFWRYTDLLSRSAQSVDRFLAPSVFSAQLHAERGFDRPVSCLPPFAPAADDEWRSPQPRPHQPPYYLYVGRLESIKGIDTLVEAWRDRTTADLVIVGDGAQRHELEGAAARNPHIVVRGPVAADALGPYYAHAIALLVPSRVYEVAPTVVLEAFARKTPVIARDVAGASELVRQGQGGLLYSTPTELREALDRLAHDATLRREAGERGYASFKQRWTADTHVSAYLALIDEIAADKFGQVPWDSPS